MKRLVLFICLLSVFNTSEAQTKVIQSERAQQELNRRGEVYFSFNLADLNQLKVLTQKISISNVKGNTVFAYANLNEFLDFVTYNYDYEVLTAPSELYPVEMSDNPKQVLTWNYYPTYTAYETLMQDFATQYPSICKLITITTLASGRKILALRISDNVNLEENEPEFLYTSSIHGDETTGYILMLHLADYLLSGYGNVTRITNMVNNSDIVICPLANPDGTYYGGNSSVNGARRYNANNVDLNRNYADPRAGQHPDGNVWQPETVAFMNFAAANTFTMGANFHGGSEVVNYPWDTWAKLSADDAWWIYVSREYADTVHVNAVPTYMSDFVNGITNGHAWYEITGGRQDYMNFYRYCREVTIEISNTKLLPTSQLIPHWNYNYRSLLNYIEESGYGLRGLVTDSMSGEPLFAKINISGFDKDSSQVYTDPQVGDYHRLLKGGTYNVTYSAPGYVSKTFSVQITDKQATIRNVQLYNGRLETNFTADVTTVAVDQPVHFTDQSAGNPVSWSWTFEGGSPASSADKNPAVSYPQPGNYTVKLVVTRTGAIDSLVRNQYIEVKPWYFMNTKTYTVCDAHFFDTGGPLGHYTANESSVITFYPAEQTKKLSAKFNTLEIETGGANCANDKLQVFDGASVTDNLIATLCGSTLPDKITASNSAGVLTFRFESNGSNSLGGWDITLSCDSNVGITENIVSNVKIYPNPVHYGNTVIETDYPIEQLIIRDITGKIINSVTPMANRFILKCDWPSGIYLIQMQIKGKWITKKIQVIKS
ncbi:MAG: M14 family zinc carboxypeptidase [Bacteroidota bacterium]